MLFLLIHTFYLLSFFCIKDVDNSTDITRHWLQMAADAGSGEAACELFRMSTEKTVYICNCSGNSIVGGFVACGKNC